MFFGPVGSGSIIICILRIRIRLLPSASKKIKINHDFYCLSLINDKLSLKTDVNVPTLKARNKQRNLSRGRGKSYCTGTEPSTNNHYCGAGAEEPNLNSLLEPEKKFYRKNVIAEEVFVNWYSFNPFT
jgi:hypothetical protein